jgi:2-iminobutanoate/2-iminopropanoate deaminase
MIKEKIETTAAPAAIGPYSQGVASENFIFVSGQLPVDPATGSFAQGDAADLTRQAMKNLEAVLEEAGSSLTEVVKTTIYVVDLGDFESVNTAYGSFFEGIAPARSCVQVAALPKGARVEIEAIAARSLKQN